MISIFVWFFELMGKVKVSLMRHDKAGIAAVTSKLTASTVHDNLIRFYPPCYICVYHED